MAKVLEVQLDPEQEKNERENGNDFGLFSKQYVFQHGLHLLGTSATWFFLNIASNSHNLFQKDIFSAIGWVPEAKTMNALEEITLIALCITVPGYWFSVALIDNISSIHVCLGHALTSLDSNSAPNWLRCDVLIRFLLCQFRSQCITSVVPAEIFPARLRSTCHGISTASGKAGAIVGAFGFSYAVDDVGVRGILIILGVANFLGLMFTFSVPESKGKSLEELVGEAEPENGSTAESRQAVPYLCIILRVTGGCMDKHACEHNKLRILLSFLAANYLVLNAGRRTEVYDYWCGYCFVFIAKGCGAFLNKPLWSHI
ncbi:hypothetical protein SADUNF_Sadunf08G0136900 [Salix dunnii]|uniref:Major facilitator superfamily (MFS) profile domain-containing protein n=1 Tax=Salix dunnii TaxID=1413687 RepID=A0A835MY51_9ROSI|nr:hypothetical protein SADUNF_Sadunf08G0136900 [Salix dunnii]